MSKLLARFACLIGRHHRSRGQAHEEDGVLVSVCRGCGRRMTRDARGWHVA